MLSSYLQFYNVQNPCRCGAQHNKEVTKRENGNQMWESWESQVIYRFFKLDYSQETQPKTIQAGGFLSPIQHSTGTANNRREEIHSELRLPHLEDRWFWVSTETTRLSLTSIQNSRNGQEITSNAEWKAAEEISNLCWSLTLTLIRTLWGNSNHFSTR